MDNLGYDTSVFSHCVGKTGYNKKDSTTENKSQRLLRNSSDMLLSANSLTHMSTAEQ